MSETPEKFFRMKMKTMFNASKNKDNKEGHTEKEQEGQTEKETHKEENKIIKPKNKKRAVKKTSKDKIDDITHKT
jgi:hypothetical protein